MGMYSAAYPLVRIGTPPLHKGVCPHLPEPKVGVSQLGRLDKNPSTLSTLWRSPLVFNSTLDVIQAFWVIADPNQGYFFI